MIDGSFPANARLGILAGGGSVPEEVAAAAASRGHAVHVVAIDGEADARFPGVSVTNVDWGQIGRMLRAFRDSGTTHLVIVGRVSRPDLTRVKPDFGLVRAIPQIIRIMRSGGDDGVLRGVIRFFEGHGLTVVGPADVAPGLVAGDGALGEIEPSATDRDDIELGLKVVGVLGRFDVGQGVVVRSGTVVAIEGAEGTDRMLSRVAGNGASRLGVLVKRPKPQQDMRVDMPAIGPDTVSNVARAGLHGIAVLAGKVLLTQRDELLRRAGEQKVFVAGVASREASDSASLPVTSTTGDDAARGVAIIEELRPYVDSRSVVVAGKYVLAVETGEGTEAVLKRVAGLRQWGSQRIKRRVGHAVLAAGQPIEAVHVDLAAAAGLRGLAAMGADQISSAARERARVLGMELSLPDIREVRLS